MLKLKKWVLYCACLCVYILTYFIPKKANRILLISLTSEELNEDFHLIFEELQKKQYDLKIDAMRINQSVQSSLQFALHALGQVYKIRRARVVLLHDNNYVVATFKFSNTKIIQLWHANGAIKKFGNQIKRAYEIKNYTVIIAPSEVWKPIYASAFNVSEEQVYSTGLPRSDKFNDHHQISEAKNRMLLKYPLLKNKYVILYAPTFRGNTVNGISYEPIELLKLKKALPNNYAILYKYHPLQNLHTNFEDECIIDCFEEDLFELECISDCLISDYSSIIFDYSCFNKKMILYASDQQEYEKSVGFNIDYSHDMPCAITHTFSELLKELSTQDFDQQMIKSFRAKYMPERNQSNLKSIIQLIEKYVKIK